MSGKPANVRWLDEFKDPARRKRLEAHMRQMRERPAVIEEAVRQLKLKNPGPFLDLIPDDLRQKVEDANILPPQRKRGAKVKVAPPLQRAIKRVRRELDRRKRLLGGRRLPPGTWKEVIHKVVLPMMWDGDFDYLISPALPTREEIYKDVCGTIYAALDKGKPRRKTGFS